MKWETVCLPKDKGGLGIKDITKFNLALLAKWKWNLFHHNGELWAKILDSKYGGWRGLDAATSDHNTSLWWANLKLALHHPQHQTALQENIALKVGNGNKVNFWEDNWGQGDNTFSKIFQTVFNFLSAEPYYAADGTTGGQ